MKQSTQADRLYSQNITHHRGESPLYTNTTATHRTPATTSRTGTRTTAQAAALPFGLAVVQLILAYEWLISGLDKLFNPRFAAQLPSTLRDSLNGNPYTWYTAILRTLVLPHAGLFAPPVEAGETAIGITLLASAALWLWKPHARVTMYAGLAACCALPAAALLSLNYFFQGGTPLPWINPSGAFDAGVDLDILIPLISLVLLAANIQVLRAVRAHLRMPRMPYRSDLLAA